MTRLKTYTRMQPIEIQLSAVNGARRVTAETLLRLLTSDRPAKSILKRRRHCLSMTDREIELVNLLKVADARFVKNVFVPKEICLPDVSLAKAIENRFRDAVCAVR